MTSLQKIQEHLKRRFPDASIEIDAGRSSAFLDVRLNGYLYVVAWRPRGGFGLSVDQEAVFGQGPDEHYRSIAAVQRRLSSLLSRARRNGKLAKSA